MSDMNWTAFFKGRFAIILILLVAALYLFTLAYENAGMLILGVVSLLAKSYIDEVK